MSRLKPWIVIGLCALPFGALGLHALAGRIADRRLREAQERFVRAGFPQRMEELAPPANAATGNAIVRMGLFVERLEAAEKVRPWFRLLMPYGFSWWKVIGTAADEFPGLEAGIDSAATDPGFAELYEPLDGLGAVIEDRSFLWLVEEKWPGILDSARDVLAARLWSRAAHGQFGEAEIREFAHLVALANAGEGAVTTFRVGSCRGKIVAFTETLLVRFGGTLAPSVRVRLIASLESCGRFDADAKLRRLHYFRVQVLDDAVRLMRENPGSWAATYGRSWLWGDGAVLVSHLWAPWTTARYARVYDTVWRFSDAVRLQGRVPPTVLMEARGGLPGRTFDHDSSMLVGLLISEFADFESCARIRGQLLALMVAYGGASISKSGAVDFRWAEPETGIDPGSGKPFVVTVADGEVCVRGCGIDGDDDGGRPPAEIYNGGGGCSGPPAQFDFTLDGDIEVRMRLPEAGQVIDGASPKP